MRFESRTKNSGEAKAIPDFNFIRCSKIGLNSVSWLRFKEAFYSPTRLRGT